MVYRGISSKRPNNKTQLSICDTISVESDINGVVEGEIVDVGLVVALYTQITGEINGLISEKVEAAHIKDTGQQ